MFKGEGSVMIVLSVKSLPCRHHHECDPPEPMYKSPYGGTDFQYSIREMGTGRMGRIYKRSLASLPSLLGELWTSEITA